MPEDKNLSASKIETRENNNIEKPKTFENKQESAPTPEIEKTPEIRKIGLEKEAEPDMEKSGESAATGVTRDEADEKQKLRQKKIEKVLEADLKDIYMNMPPNKQNEFKIAGEQTAVKINQLLQKGKVKFGQIVDLIKKWLQIIPGINKFFLEQETKIKSDAIMKIKDSEKTEDL